MSIIQKIERARLHSTLISVAVTRTMYGWKTRLYNAEKLVKQKRRSSKVW